MKSSHNGFSLMEVLVAMVIFSISALAVTSLMVNHTKLVPLNAQSSEAIVLAQDKLEDLRTMNFTSLASNSAPSALYISRGPSPGLNRRLYWRLTSPGEEPRDERMD